jgi:hypothetical protein
MIQDYYLMVEWVDAVLVIVLAVLVAVAAVREA